jgi:hypothetical protein
MNINILECLYKFLHRNKMNKGELIIAPQTKIAFIGYILILLSKIIFTLQNPSNTKNLIPFILMFVLSATLGLYVLNCTIVGQCHVYAWIVSYIVAIFGMLMILFLFLMFL